MLEKLTALVAILFSNEAGSVKFRQCDIKAQQFGFREDELGK